MESSQPQPTVLTAPEPAPFGPAPTPIVVEGPPPGAADSETRRFERFTAELVARGRAGKTLAAYRSDHAGFQAHFASRRSGGFDLAALDPEDLDAYRDHLTERGARPATVNRKLVFVKRYADWAASRGLIPEARARALREVRAVAQAPRTPTGLTDLDRQRLLRVVEDTGTAREKALVTLMLHTGLRVSEVEGLEVGDLTMGPRSGTVWIASDPDPRRHREATLDARTALRLHRYLAERGAEPGQLFLGKRGPLTANAIQRVVRALCAEAGVHATPSVLRHTFANGFLRAGRGDLVDLADALGHESLDTTRLYARTAGVPTGVERRPNTTGGRERVTVTHQKGA